MNSKQTKNKSLPAFTFKPAGLHVKPGTEILPKYLDKAIIRHVRGLYAAEEHYPYHNWKHVEDVLMNLKPLLERCLKYSIEVDETALRHGIICHDLLYPVDAVLLGYSSKEEFAAHYSYNLLRSLGAPESHARKVEKIINATHYLVEPVTIEEVLIRAADLRGISEEYTIFFKQTKRLYRERRKNSIRKVTFNEHLRQSFILLREYFRVMLVATPEATDVHGSTWHKQAMGNILKLYLQSAKAGERPIVIVEVPVREKSVLKERGIKGNEFYIAVGVQDRLKTNLEQSKNFQINSKTNAPIFSIPGTPQALPLPDNSCDELYLRESESSSFLSEAGRVLNDGGSLYINRHHVVIDMDKLASDGFVKQKSMSTNMSDDFHHYIKLSE